MRRQLPAGVLLSAWFTFIYLFFYPELVASRFASKLQLMGIIFLFPGGLIFLVAALINRRCVVGLHCHAAAITAYSIVSSFTARIGHASPADLSIEIGLTLLWLIVGMEVIILTVIGRTAHASGALAWIASFAGLLGLVLGYSAWATVLPLRVKPQIAAVVGNEPWCLDIPERSRYRSGASYWDMTAWRMWASESGGYTFKFHGLLVIGDPSQRRYANWSYTSGRFESVMPRTRENLNLDGARRCEPHRGGPE